MKRGSGKEEEEAIPNSYGLGRRKGLIGRRRRGIHTSEDDVICYIYIMCVYVFTHTHTCVCM
jgi:hypothetical protein